MRDAPSAYQMRLGAWALVSILFSGCATYHTTSRVDGINAIQPTSDGVFVKPDPMLTVWAPSKATTQQTRVALKPRDRVSFGDGRHTTIELRFVGRDRDKYRFAIKPTNHPPDAPAQQRTEHIRVAAYGH